MIPLLGVLMLGFALMLGAMGWQQLRRGYRISAGFSLTTSAGLALIGALALLFHFDIL